MEENKWNRMKIDEDSTIDTGSIRVKAQLMVDG
jgi:hypothetical protein